MILVKFHALKAFLQAVSQANIPLDSFSSSHDGTFIDHQDRLLDYFQDCYLMFPHKYHQFQYLVIINLWRKFLKSNFKKFTVYSVCEQAFSWEIKHSFLQEAFLCIILFTCTRTHLVLGCSSTNFGPLSRRNPHSM